MGLFGFGKRQAPAPAPKRFLLDNEFEYVFQLVLMICASDYGNDLQVSVTAGADGRIDLRASGNISYFPHMLRDVHPAVEQYFCSPQRYSGDGYGSMRFSFAEPECYIYGCPQGPLEDEIREYAPNGYLDSYRKYGDGGLSFCVKFRRQSDDDVYGCFAKLKERCGIWLK